MLQIKFNQENKFEKFYKDSGAKELDSFQKKEARFTYYDMIGFADAYCSKQLNIPVVSDLLIAWEQYKKANWWESESVDVEKKLMNDFQAIYVFLLTDQQHL